MIQVLPGITKQFISDIKIWTINSSHRNRTTLWFPSIKSFIIQIFSIHKLLFTKNFSVHSPTLSREISAVEFALSRAFAGRFRNECILCIMNCICSYQENGNSIKRVYRETVKQHGRILFIPIILRLCRERTCRLLDNAWTDKNIEIYRYKYRNSISTIVLYILRNFNILQFLLKVQTFNESCQRLKLLFV